MSAPTGSQGALWLRPVAPVGCAGSTRPWPPSAPPRTTFARSTPANHPPFTTYYNAAFLAGNTREALFDLVVLGHNRTQATDQLTAAADGHTASHARPRTACLTKLASPTMATGDPIQAATIGHAALDAAGGIRSRRVTNLREQARYFTEHQHIDEVAHLPGSARATMSWPHEDERAGRLSAVDVTSIFGELVGELDYSMFIVTVRAGEQRAGCLVGFGTQSSIDPPRFLVCLSRKNHTYRVANGSEAMVVHFVPQQAEALARLFGGHSGDDVDKFARCAWEPGPGGLPILQDCRNWFVGRVLERLDLGDHVGFLLEPIVAHHEGNQSHFEFHRAKNIPPGHPA
ncbi:MAG: flavin reductase family protein [Pseudonocardiaceae bacterium]